MLSHIEGNQFLEANLAGKKLTLTSLWHPNIRSRDADNCTIHPSSASNRVINVCCCSRDVRWQTRGLQLIIGASGTVDVAITTGLGLLLNVGGFHGDATSLFLWALSMDA